MRIPRDRFAAPSAHASLPPGHSRKQGTAVAKFDLLRSPARQGSKGLPGYLWLGFACILGSALALGAMAQSAVVERGEYLVRAGGCFTCHTASGGMPLAGGRPLATPFGTFYSPNITPDRETGIGAWRDADFLRALREGIRPDGANYFPVFPYPSFTGITDEDALAIKAFLFSRAPVHRSNQPHDISFPFSLRFLQSGWKFLYFREGPFHRSPQWDEATNRGAYLVTSLGHCGECHTPRNVFGAVRRHLWLSGTFDGPDGELVPNLTPDARTGIGDWDQTDIVELLKTGATPDQAKVTGSMHDVVADGTKYLTDADRAAIASYLHAQRPIARAISASERDNRRWYRRLWDLFMGLIGF
jgi:mono/diheme cytochrome c family protein